MRGLSIVEGALYMRGVDPSVDQIIKEAQRISSLTYLKGKERMLKKVFDSLSAWSPYEVLAKFLASNFDEGLGYCSRFKEGDLVEAKAGSWKYGIVRGIVTEWNSTAEPDCFCIEVSIKNDKTDTVFWRRFKEGDVYLANLPPEIMELARSQVVAKCPLMNGGCA